MVFLRYRWMGHDYWGIGVTIVHFISTNEFILLSTMKYVKLSTLPLITFVVIFGTLIAFYLYLDSIRYLTPKETTLFGCTEPLAAIISSVLILQVPFQSFQLLGAFCVIVMVLILSQKPDEGKQKLKLVHAKRKIYNERIEFTMPVPQNYKTGRVSAKSLVLNQLQNWIIEGVLKPNEKINDGELAEALGVSRTPVREALQILELSGLVEMVRGKTKIAPIKLDDVSIIYETMAGLHSIIGKQALQNITNADIQLLSEINEHFQQSIEKNAKQALELDIQFHNTISSIAKTNILNPF